MYTKEEREGILWEFHRSGLFAPAACRSLPLFPNKDNLYAWLKLEEADELTAREMPDRAECMHCSHGEGSPAFAVSVNLFFTSFAKQACRSRKGGFTGCANVFSPIPVTA